MKTAAWNTGWHHGVDFVQWTGSQAQKDALARVHELSQAAHAARWKAGERHVEDTALHGELEDAFWHLLRAETSCNFYWGEAWVNRCHADLDQAWMHLDRARERLPD